MLMFYPLALVHPLLVGSVGIVSPSVPFNNRTLPSLEVQSSREGISSGGEDDGGADVDRPWSAGEVELLDSLVRSYGEHRCKRKSWYLCYS